MMPSRVSGKRLPSRARQRGQAAITLVEVLVALAISSAILGPVGGWMILSITSQAPTAGRFNDAAQARLVETYITRDVASAEELVPRSWAAAPDPLPAMADCGVSANVILNLYEHGSEESLIVYGTTTDGGRASLRRWTCTPDKRDVGPTTSQLEVLRDLAVDGASGQPIASARCVTPDSSPGPCKRVTVGATLVSDANESGADVEVSASRRSTVEPPPNGMRPVALIGEPTIRARAGSDPFTIEVSAQSWDLDSNDLKHEWTFEGSTSDDATAVFESESAGEFTIYLKTTDTRPDGTEGNVARTSRKVILVNEPPQVEDMTVTLSNGGITAYPSTDVTLSASVVDDSDQFNPATCATEVEWDWDGVILPGASVVFLAPDGGWPLGEHTIRLTANDCEGETTTRTATVRVVAEGEAEIRPYPPPPNAGNPVYLSTDAGVQVEWSLVGDQELSRWELVDGDQTQRVPATGGFPTGGAQSFEFSRPQCTTGDYTIRAVLTNGEIVEQPFSVDWALSPLMSYSEPVGLPARVSFNDLSSPAGCISQWQWSFGWPAPGWTSEEQNPTHDFTHPGLYAISLEVTGTDGRTDSVEGQLRVPGAPADAPEPPTWDGTKFTWSPIPGVEQYRLSTTYSGPNCLKNGTTVPVDPGGPFEASGGVNTCPSPRLTSATLSILVNGEWFKSASVEQPA